MELDEMYFWASRVRWKRGRWASWKIKVFWLLKRDGKVYTTEGNSGNKVSNKEYPIDTEYITA